MTPVELQHRLRSTHAREWPHRVREQVRRWRDTRRGEDVPVATLPETLVRSPAPTWPMPDRWNLSEDARAELARSVRSILDNKVELLGVPYPNAAAWDVDPPTQTRWEREKPGVAVDLHAGGRDIKLAWELHRLQHLQILAIGARALDMPEAADRCRDLLIDWLVDQRPYQGIAWASGLEVASRAVSLLVIAGALGPCEPALNAAVWHAITAHARWLCRFPSLHSSANNHRVGEVAALVILGCLAEDHPEAATWRLYARELETRIVDLIHEDGVPAEQSPTYGAYSLEWALLARRALAERGLRFAAEDRLRQAGRFLAGLVDDGGHWPRFGDDDEGSVLRGGLAPDPLPTSVAACLASALDIPDATPHAAGSDVRSHLLGLELRTDPPRDGRRTFEAGGYTLWRSRGSGESIVLFDHGPLGHGATCGHGHADALSIWWHLEGRPILVDAGVYRYNGAPAWRRYTRSTLAHNTVTVDGRSQSEALGPFTWGRRAEASLLPARGDAIRASHDGYDPFDCRHERAVNVVDGDRILIDDRVHGADDHMVHGSWHLDPGLEVHAIDPHTVELRDADLRIRVQVTGARIRVVRGDGAPGPGTISPAYNQVAPTHTLLVDPAHPSHWTTRFERLR